MSNSFVPKKPASSEMSIKEYGVTQAGTPCPPNMVFVPGGTFRMGSDNHYREEAPAHGVKVEGFFMDRTPVTNRQFKEFVKATGYVTVAEQIPDARDYPGALPHMLYAGSMVFQKSAGPVDLRKPTEWWAFVKGANWRHPLGPGSGLFKKENHPVVHVAYDDAVAYARWAGKELPTEAEWEYAAWGSVEDAEFAWGNEFAPGGKQMANTWQGKFPYLNLLDDGFERTSPVGFYPANGYGLHDMIGNVWEWTNDWWSVSHAEEQTKSCCIPHNPRGGPEVASYDERQPSILIPRKVVKGGSHLCAPNYCRRYRPAARHAQPIDTSMSHVGFRCIVRMDHSEFVGGSSA
jgi:formylglycine-generating enzyme required for sulfatase activity